MAHGIGQRPARGAQQRDLFGRAAERARRLPQGVREGLGRERIRRDRDIGQPAQRRGEGLQLSQFPFGDAVDLRCDTRDLDIGVVRRFVEQCQAAHRGRRRCRCRGAVGTHALRERGDEGFGEAPALRVE
ncbi:MAG TPA: hypothetical protein PLG77_16560 [Burkholderiaceae bacterium]|nr:hypothetical protein [Burkholderiaceae bacterium]